MCTSGAPYPLKGVCHAARRETRGREAIHASTSSAYHATLQAPSRTRWGIGWQPQECDMGKRVRYAVDVQLLFRY